VGRSLVGGRGEQKQQQDRGRAAEAAARRAIEAARTAMVASDARAGIVHLYEAADLASPGHPALAASALLQLLAPSLSSGRVPDAFAALIGARSHLPLITCCDRHILDDATRAAEAALDLITGASADPSSLVAVASPPPSFLWTSGDASALISAVAVSLVHAERTAVARDLLRPAVERWRAVGDRPPLPLALAALAMAERRAGHPTRALPLAAEARDLAEATGRHRAWLYAHVELANAHSVAGDAERCRAAAAVVLTDPAAAPLHRLSARSALASVELWSGDPTAVIDLLEPLVREGVPDPRIALFHQTLVAAYVQVGRHHDAEPLRRALLDACPDAPGRLRGAALMSKALLAGADERDAWFQAAIAGCGDQAVLRACVQLQYGRRLLADGCEEAAIRVLTELASERDEDVLGLARSARRDLARLGLEHHGRDAPWLERARAELRPRPAGPGAAGSPSIEIDLLGGLEVRVDGRPVDVPLGAASTAVAALAVHRSVHVEQLTDLLWPDAAPSIGRRRLRNVLSRIRTATDGLVVRRGDRLELADQVVVDDDVLEARAREVLAMPPGPDRAAAAAALLHTDRQPFLPEARYEDWADAGRFRTDTRRAQLAAACELVG
jgi:hypothetical protein